MYVSQLLKQKGGEVFRISPEATARQALEEMVRDRVGSLLVMEGGKVVGIITERDIIRQGLTGGKLLIDQQVKDVMSGDVMIATPEDNLQYVMGVMTRNRIRHMPVFDKDQLVGVVSIGDLVFAQLEQSEQENRYLKDYISGTW